MFKPQKPTGPQQPNRHKLPIVERPPKQEDIATLFTGALRIRGTIFELPIRPTPLGQLYVITCQFDHNCNETVWGMYEGSATTSEPLFSCPQTDLDMVFDMVCMACQPAGGGAAMPAELAPDYGGLGLPPAPTPPTPAPPPVPAPAAAPPPAPQYQQQGGFGQAPPPQPYPQNYPPPQNPYGQQGQGYPPPQNPYGQQQYPQQQGFGQPQQQQQPYPQNYPPQQQGYNQGPPQNQGYGQPPPPQQQAPYNPYPNAPAAAPAPQIATPEFSNFIDLLNKGSPNLLLGHMLVEAGIVPDRCLDAALKLQELVRHGKLTNEQAVLAMKRAAELGGNLDDDIIQWAKDPDAALRRARAQSNTAPTQRPAAAPAAAPAGRDNVTAQRIVELLKQAGLVNDDDLETARKVKAKHGGDLSLILVSAGKLGANTVEAAAEVQNLVAVGRLRIDKAINALHYCERMRVGLKEAMNELSIELS